MAITVTKPSKGISFEKEHSEETGTQHITPVFSEIIITLTNDHARAVQKIKKDYNLKNEASVFAYLLSVAEDANGASLGFESRTRYFRPAKDIRNEDEE